MIKSKTHTELPLLSTSEDVLVPHTTVPLQLQPQRFRALDEETRTGDRLLGMATVSDQPTQLSPNDLSRRIIGLGRISETEQLTGEGHVLYLKGLSRALITDGPDEQDDSPVPAIDAQEIDDRLDAPRKADELIWSIRGGLLILQDRGIEGAEMLNYEVSNLDAPGAVADIVGAAVFPDLDGKRQLLEYLDVLARLRHVDERLADLVVEAYHSNPPEARERN